MFKPDKSVAQRVTVRWIASYPKSGNTWLRFLLYQYFNGAAESSAQISRFIPDMHHKGSLHGVKPFEGSIFVKTHLPLDQRLPLREHTRDFVHVVRHPRDTILSCLNYARLINSPDVAGGVTDEQYVRGFIARGGSAWYAGLGFGTWEEHCASWIDNTEFPGLLVRYEDLKKQTPAELRRILEFLGHPVDQSRVDQAVKLSSFDHMRALEVKEKSSGTTGEVFAGGADKARKGQFFMNKGQSGRSLDTIARGLDAAVNDRFAAMLRRLGYER